MQKKLTGFALVLLMIGVSIGAVVAAGVPAGQLSGGTTHRVPTMNSIPGMPGMDTAITNNETIYATAGVQYVQEISSLVSQNHGTGGFSFTIPARAAAYLETPFVLPSKKNGKNTYVRYLWFTIKMPADVNVSSMAVHSGPTLLYSNYIDRRGTGAVRTYLADMGSLKAIPYGVNLHLEVYNPTAASRTVESFGASLLQVW